MNLRNTWAASGAVKVSVLRTVICVELKRGLAATNECSPDVCGVSDFRDSLFRCASYATKGKMEDRTRNSHDISKIFSSRGKL